MNVWWFQVRSVLGTYLPLFEFAEQCPSFFGMTQSKATFSLVVGFWKNIWYPQVHIFSRFDWAIFGASWFNQCCGSMKFWYGSGSADPYLWIMDPDSDPDADPDPAIFVTGSDLQDVSKKLPFFVLITFWRYIYIIFQREKVIKKSQNSRNQCFSYYH